MTDETRKRAIEALATKAWTGNDGRSAELMLDAITSHVGAVYGLTAAGEAKAKDAPDSAVAGSGHASTGVARTVSDCDVRGGVVAGASTSEVTPKNVEDVWWQADDDQEAIFKRVSEWVNAEIRQAREEERTKARTATERELDLQGESWAKQQDEAVAAERAKVNAEWQETWADVLAEIGSKATTADGAMAVLKEWRDEAVRKARVKLAEHVVGCVSYVFGEKRSNDEQEVVEYVRSLLEVETYDDKSRDDCPECGRLASQCDPTSRATPPSAKDRTDETARERELEMPAVPQDGSSTEARRSAMSVVQGDDAPARMASGSSRFSGAARDGSGSRPSVATPSAKGPPETFRWPNIVHLSTDLRAVDDEHTGEVHEYIPADLAAKQVEEAVSLAIPEHVRRFERVAYDLDKLRADIRAIVRPTEMDTPLDAARRVMARVAELTTMYEGLVAAVVQATPDAHEEDSPVDRVKTLELDADVEWERAEAAEKRVAELAEGSEHYHDRAERAEAELAEFKTSLEAEATAHVRADRELAECKAKLAAFTKAVLDNFGLEVKP